ncbi:uncharacterized protein SAPINGB_P001465 [Magnusiomyces paraingens]|uniref:Copper acquisition factor BIM1-like domain-containing protein n=1 Tax=Magnusiomyces paraingens TaxID=2606893 RepID=A0A5E8B631_9ASCO|nr:uncharacterized protein SAPINGB_P001465 [Saprochaete ingens]VVT46944.1 unnamed protein product [Saprochaete ingens]
MKLSSTFIAASIPFLTSLVSAQDHGEEYAQTMGPVAFLWPPDRDWTEASENTAPCGSGASITNRTIFPLTGGHVLLVAQDEAWDVKVAISYKSNPTSMNDFQDWFSANLTNDLDTAHMCYSTPNVLSSVKEGDYGTIQLVYNALDGTSNISHYACADVEFVELENFVQNGYSSFCFNTTEEETAPSDTPSGVDDSSANSVASSVAGSTSTASIGAASTSSASASATSSKNDASSYAFSGFVAIAGVIAAMV